MSNKILKLEATAENPATIQIQKPKYPPCGTFPPSVMSPEMNATGQLQTPILSILISKPTPHRHLPSRINQRTPRNTLLRLEAMATNSERDDSDSDVTVRVNPEQYCTLFLYIRFTTDLI